MQCFLFAYIYFCDQLISKSPTRAFSEASCRRERPGWPFHPESTASAADDSHEITELLIDVARLSDGLRNFFAQQLAITLPQPMRHDFDVPHRDPEPLCKLRIGDQVSVAPKVRLKRLEQVAPSDLQIFSAQPLYHPIQNRERPAQFKVLRRIRADSRLREVACFGIMVIQGHQRSAAATLLGLASLVRIPQEIFHRGHEEGTKPAPFPHRSSHGVPFQKIP